MINKYLKIIIIIILVFYILEIFNKKPKKQWLFLLNGNNAYIKNNKIELNLNYNMIAFTDRPYHEISHLNKDEMLEIFNKINKTKNKPNTTLIAINDIKKDYSTSAIIEINKINFSKKKNKDIEIYFKVLEGKINKQYYDNISLTIDDFWGWIKKASSNVSHVVSHAVKSVTNVVKEAVNPETYKKAFNSACKKVAYPIIEHVATGAAIDWGCNTFCPETAAAVDAAGGGPEDPIGDGIAVAELAGCDGTCISALRAGLRTYNAAKTVDPSLNKTVYLRDKLCNTMFKT